LRLLKQYEPRSCEEREDQREGKHKQMRLLRVCLRVLRLFAVRIGFWAQTLHRERVTCPASRSCWIPDGDRHLSRRALLRRFFADAFGSAATEVERFD